MKYILIAYPENQVGPGGNSIDPFNLFGWLVNELDNSRIEARVMAYDEDPRRARSKHG